MIKSGARTRPRAEPVAIVQLMLSEPSRLAEGTTQNVTNEETEMSRLVTMTSKK